MGFLASIFGGGDDESAPAPAPAPAPVAPAPVQEMVLEEPVEDRTDIDPNLDQALSSAKRTRKALAARTGRSDLVTSRTGVSIVGSKS